MDLKFGWEFEATDYNMDNWRGNLDGVKDFLEKKSDGSVRGAGVEFVLKEPQNYEDSVKYLWKFLETLQPKTDTSCGFHVHVSDPQWSPRGKTKIANAVLALSALCEEKIFKAVPSSRHNNTFCKKLAADYHSNMSAKKSLGKIFRGKHDNRKRYNWLNFVEFFRPGGLGTVEFRLMGNSSRFFYLADWVYFCSEMIKNAEKIHIDRPLTIAHAFLDMNFHIDRLIDAHNKKLNWQIPCFLYSIEKYFLDRDFVEKVKPIEEQPAQEVPAQETPTRETI